MDELIKIVVEHIPDAALPVVICFLFTYYIQYKRKETKSERDRDSLELHDNVEKHTWEISRLKDDMALHNTLMEDIRTTVDALNVSTAKLSVTVESLNETVKELKK